MIDRKSQLNLFGKGRRARPQPSVVEPALGSIEAMAPRSAEPTGAGDEATEAIAPPSAEPSGAEAEATEAITPASADAIEALAATAAVSLPVTATAPSVESLEAVPAAVEPSAPGPIGAEAAAAPPVESGGGPAQSSSEAVMPGLRPPTGAQYLFPPSDERRRVDMHFSRRMSDLIRRLQLLEREAKSELGLTLPQAHAIHALDAAGSLRMQELAATLGLAQSTVTRLVAPLKRVGLLDRRPDRNDGRATRAYLTDEGQRSVDKLEHADRTLYRGLLDRIPATRRAEVVAAIELLHEVVLSVARGED